MRDDPATARPGGTGRLVVAGVESSYLHVLAEHLARAGLDPVVLVEAAARPPLRPLPPALRIGESLYQRLWGRRLGRKAASLDDYWKERIPRRRRAPAHAVDSLNGSQARGLLRSLNADLMLTYGPRILERDTFSAPRLGTVNLHAGRLPEFRGTLAEFWTLKRGRYADVGVTLHRMTPRLDAGDVFFFLPVPGRPSDDEWDARLRWQRSLLWVIPGWIRAILDGSARAAPQTPATRRAFRTPTFLDRLPVDLRCAAARLLRPRTPVTDELSFPPGRRAAVAVSTDIDGTTIDRFREVHALFHGPLRWTEFADSLFFYQADTEARRAGQISMFDGLRPQPDPRFHDALRDALRDGRVEVNHAWGDFSESGGFHRSLAESAVRRLEGEGVRLPLWVNHGDRFNAQALGPLAPHAQGDDPRAGDVYHLDLTRRAGARYFWVGHLNPFPVLGGPPLRVGEALSPVSLDSPARLRPIAWALAWLHSRTRWTPLLKAVHRLGWQFLPDRRLLVLHRFRDGSSGWLFQRSGRWERDDWRAIPMLLHDAAIDRAVREGGAILVYTHLGSGMPSAETLGRLEDLARRPEIWRTSVGRLLDAALSVVDPDSPLFDAPGP